MKLKEYISSLESERLRYRQKMGEGLTVWVLVIIILISQVFLFWCVMYDIRLNQKLYQALGVTVPGVANVLW